MAEPDESQLAIELLEALEALTASITAATKELAKLTFRMRMEQLDRAEIAMLERWFRL